MMELMMALRNENYVTYDERAHREIYVSKYSTQ